MAKSQRRASSEVESKSYTTDSVELGSCCGCGKREAVRHVVPLPFQAPQEGAGAWGCDLCGLPRNGAIAVLCDGCNAAVPPVIKFVCVGSPRDGRRFPLSAVEGIPFLHDKAKHDAGGVS